MLTSEFFCDRYLALKALVVHLLQDTRSGLIIDHDVLSFLLLLIASNFLFYMHQLGDAAGVEDKVVLVATAAGAPRTS